MDVEPHIKKVPIHRSEKISQAPDRYGFYVAAENHELRDLNEPPNYKAALSDPESDKWIDAMNAKMQSIKDNQVCHLVNLPPNGRTDGSKWIFKKETDMDGNVHTFKARLVAKDYTQTYTIDYGETFSFVANIRVIRILLAILTFYNYEIWQMDVKNAFLNGLLSEDNKRFDKEIKKVGFTQNPDEPCVYVKASDSNVAFLVLYVDDILIIGNNVTMLQDAKSWIYKCFSMKYLGEAAYILMENSKRGSVPMQEKPNLSKTQGANTPNEGALAPFAPHVAPPLIAAMEALMEAVWMKKFIDGLGDVVPTNKRPMEMLCDNTGAIAITNDLRIMKGARHYQRKYHYIREVIHNGEIVLNKVHTNDNIADPFTKPMPYTKHFEHAMGIGVHLANSLM
ncbi:retrotransposon protein, putative, ty1-copia subclass [Tanacetum coccineum]